MKILITSDTHSMYNKISDLILEREDIDLLIHAGDGVDDCKYINYETGIKYYVVKGNNDYFSDQPYEKVIQLLGHKILLSHGHKENIDVSINQLFQKALDYDCDIVIFGHIHRYVNIERNGILFLNPGSPILPRDGQSSCIIMVLEEDKIEIEKISLD